MSIQLIRGICLLFAIQRDTTYNLRCTHMLTLNKPRTTTYGLHYFSYFSAQQWNDLPDELRNSTFPDFKRRVQSLNTFDYFH